MRLGYGIWAALLLLGCGTQTESVVEWPALLALDHEVAALDGLLGDDADPAALAKQLAEVTTALETLFAGGKPAQLNHPALVETKLEELKALTDDLGSDPALLPALKPLVAAILEEAGMSHAHGDCCPHHDHDHDAQY